MKGLPGQRFAAPEMHYEPAAAPAAAPAFSLTIGLWALVALLVAIGLKAGWDHTLGAILRGLGSAADVGVWKIKVKAGGGFRKLDDVVQATLGDYILLNEKVLGVWWHTNKAIVGYLADSVADFGADVHDTIHGLVHGTIPAIAADIAKPWTQQVGKVAKQITVVNRYVTTKVVRVVQAQARTAEQEFGKAHRGIDYILDRAIPRVWRGVHSAQGQIAAERTYAHRVLNKRLTWLEKALGVGALSGIAIAALTRVFPYWQCTSFRRFSRLICRSPLGALEDLFGLALLAVGPLSIVEFAKLLQGVVEEVDDGVRFFVT